MKSSRVHFICGEVDWQSLDCKCRFILRLGYSVLPTHLLLLPTNELCGLFNYYVVCGHAMCQPPDGLFSSLR